jgi:hypothetical protein
VSDFQAVLEATKKFIENKNFDEGFQTTMMEAGAAAKNMGTTAKELRTDQTKQIASDHGKKIKEHGMNLTWSVWDVLKLMVKSGEFRSHVVTLLGVLQELLTIEKTPFQAQQTTPSVTAPPPSPPALLTTQLSKDASPPPPPPVVTTGQSIAADTSTSSQGSCGRFTSKLSEEKRQQLVTSLLAVLKQFNERPQFKQGLEEISQMFRQLNKQKDDPELGAPSSKLRQSWKENPHADAAFEKSKQLVERFSKRSAEPLIQKNSALFQYIRTHEMAHQWLKDLSAVLRDGVSHPHELDEKEFRGRIEKLVDDADVLSADQELRKKYSDLTTELKTVFDAIRDDIDLLRLQCATAQFLDNFLVTDAQGKKHFSPDFVQQLRQFMVPLLMAQIERIPIPPIEGSDEELDYSLDNMVLYGKEVLPDSIEIKQRSTVSLKPRDLTTKSNSRADIWIPGIKLTISDFHFKFHRKTFPKISDEGNATVKVEGDTGASMRLRVGLSVVNGAPCMTLNKVNFDIDKLKIQILDAKHDIILKMFTSVYQSRIKKMIEQKTEETIREIFVRLETGMNDLFTRYPPSRLKAMISSKVDSSTEIPIQPIQAHALQS